ncbi:MAG: sulfatase-like hydrolase/transferase, partial [Pirellulales bacterium]|nr:sulfatase-like hydrolase/transferase [Pirellulales bacterium]
MKRHPLIAHLAVLACLLGAPLSFAVDAPNGDKPNIILVMADDQGWGDVGYNGHPFVKTPAMDAMAKEAFVLDRFYAGAP